MIARVLLASVALFFGEPAPEQAFHARAGGQSGSRCSSQALESRRDCWERRLSARGSRRNETGTAAFILSINDQGLVTHCRIETSSGSMELDGQTCHLYRERARFEPAQDKSGRKIASSLRQRIRWSIPDGRVIMLAETHDRLTLDVAFDGKIENCRMEVVKGATPSSRDCIRDAHLQGRLLTWLKEIPLLRGGTMVHDLPHYR